VLNEGGKTEGSGASQLKRLIWGEKAEQNSPDNRLQSALRRGILDQATTNWRGKDL